MNDFNYDRNLAPPRNVPPTIEPERPEPRPNPPSRLERPRRNWTGTLALIFSALALLLAGTALYLLLDKNEPEPPPILQPEPPRVRYRDRSLPVLDGVPVNSFDPSDFSWTQERAVYTSGTTTLSKTGVDISYSQGAEIDWQAVAADGIDFAILRLGYRGYTEGGLFLDKYFTENFQGALDAGLEVGVYFFSQALTPQEAEEEAQFVLDQLERYDTRDLFTYPIVYDFEYYHPDKNARTNQLDGQTLTQCAAAFCSVIAQAGYTPAVYFNQDLGYLSYDLSQLCQYPFWLADYDTAPDFYYRFDLWQYSHTGTVAGIPGNVDLNLDVGLPRSIE